MTRDSEAASWFKRVRTTGTLSRDTPPSLGKSIPWDDKTVNWIADSGQININVTSINRTLSVGKGDPEEWEIYGVIEYPKFVAVNIRFDPSNAGNGNCIGGFFYNILNCGRFGKNKIDIPLLEIYFFDGDSRIRRLLYQAHRDALLSGRTFSGLRVFKKQKHGYMNESDKRDGWSASERYSLDSLVTWADLTHENVPKWSLPPSDSDFSLNDLRS